MAGTGRSRRDRILAASLAAGATERAAADAAACSERTVRRRLEDTEFQELLVETRGRICQEVLGRAVSHASRAVGVLGEIMDNQEFRPAVRVSAARALLDCVLRFRETDELVRRIEHIEALLPDRAGQRHGSGDSSCRD